MALTFNWLVFTRLLKDAWPAWITMAGITGSIILGRVSSPDLSAVARYAGTLLQLLGLATVAIGLGKTLKLFGRPSLLTMISGWFRRWASVFSSPKTTVLQAVSPAAQAIVSSNLRVIQHPGPGAPLEERVSFLEEELTRLNEDMNANRQRLQRNIHAVREDLERQIREHRTGIQQLDHRTEEIGVGGLHWEVIGLLWLGCGVIGTSIPDEIASVLRLVF